MQGKGQSQRVKDRGKVNGQGYSNPGLEYRVRIRGWGTVIVWGQGSGVKGQDHSQCQSAGYVQVRIRVTCRSGSGSGDRL